jgi:integrase/recombinase XerD
MVNKAVIKKIVHRNNFWFGIKFTFDTDTIRLVKRIPGARWSETYRLWLIPIDQDSVHSLKEIFSEIDCLDNACRIQFGIPAKEKDASFQELISAGNALEQFTSDEVPIFENREFIYIKADPYNQKDRSFLASLEFSRNFLDSGYWKILSRDEVGQKLRQYFSDRLKNTSNLLEEINEFELKRRNKNKVSAFIEGKKVKVMFGWNKELIAFIKTMPFHSWHPEDKYWTFAYNKRTISALRDLCAQKKFELQIDHVSTTKKIMKRALECNDPDYRKCPAEMVDKLKNRRYSASTIKQYISMFEEFINYFHDVAIEDLDAVHVKEFISYLVQERHISPSYQNISVNAIKFYFEKVLGKPRSVIGIDRPRNEKHLPEFLTKDEVISMISTIKNLKHRFILILLYSTGLRRGELLNLKRGDIDRDHMQIWVRGGKGKKDRYVQLGNNTLKVLDEYILLYDPKDYLIEGRGEKYSVTSISEIIKAAARNAGINKKITPHKFRHSYATHLLEDGVDIRFIQELLGHSSIKTTQIYSHVTDRNIKNIVNPFDKMDI